MKTAKNKKRCRIIFICGLKEVAICATMTAIACLILLFAGKVQQNHAEQPTDYHNHELSEQISQEEWRELAKQQWREEYGEFQPDLTADVEAYLAKQADIYQQHISHLTENAANE